jgi:hypothetical protein
MGRPVNKRKFGLLDDGTNITINCQVGSNAESDNGIILSQRSVNKFKVNDAADGSGNTGVCTLVDKAAGALGANEMSIQGYILGAGTQKRIKKLFNRTCRDFNNIRYTYTIDNDSSESRLVLTAI